MSPLCHAGTATGDLVGCPLSLEQGAAAPSSRDWSILVGQGTFPNLLEPFGSVQGLGRSFHSRGCWGGKRTISVVTWGTVCSPASIDVTARELEHNDGAPDKLPPPGLCALGFTWTCRACSLLESLWIPSSTANSLRSRTPFSMALQLPGGTLRSSLREHLSLTLAGVSCRGWESLSSSQRPCQDPRTGIPGAWLHSHPVPCPRSPSTGAAGPPGPEIFSCIPQVSWE